jgi:prepilin-type N-terminal cleavage/methylation domain-containing protein
MRHPRKIQSERHKSAFSLIEMIAVIAILVALMTASVSLLNGNSSQSRKATADLLTGLMEQAKSTAITSRSFVVLAIAEPGDLPAGDDKCRIGLFKVEEWPDSDGNVPILKGVLLNRWQIINSGIAICGEKVDGIANPIDEPQVTIEYGGTRNLSVVVHAIAFNSRGGLHYPFGSTPIAMRIAEGGYRQGKATPNLKGPSRTATENRIKIGRITARPYSIDG